jgi:hypothetical protein
MNVDGSPRILTGIDRREPRHPIGFRDLIAAQEILSSESTDIGVVAEGVGVPDIYQSVS